MQPYIETRIYVEDLEEFLKLCAGDAWEGSFSIGSSFGYEIKQIKKSRAKRPKFELLIRSKKVVIYPKEKLVTGVECRLHYVCQHSFDMFPREVKQQFYGHDFDRRKIGILHTLKGEEFEVFNTDILDGFTLHTEKQQEFGDSFVRWIRYRRNKEKDLDGKD